MHILGERWRFLIVLSLDVSLECHSEEKLFEIGSMGSLELRLDSVGEVVASKAVAEHREPRRSEDTGPSVLVAEYKGEVAWRVLQTCWRKVGS